MSTNKCNYIVSNTIEIDEALGAVIEYDLHKRQGRYTYLYPSNLKLSTQFGIGITTESVAVMFTENIDTEVHFNG